MTGAQLARLAPTATPQEAVDVIMRDGGVIIEDLYDAATIAGLVEDLNPVLASVDAGHDPEFLGTRTRRASGLFGRTHHMVTIAMNPLYRGVAELIINRPFDVFVGSEQSFLTPGMQIGVTQAIQIAPGQGSQPLHRDDLVWLWRHPGLGREARVQIMVAVTDFTAENGGTLVIPGSHRWDDERQPRIEEAVSTEMSAGSALIFIGSTYHGGGTNRSTDLRTGVTMAYDLAFLRAEENHLLTLPLDAVRELPPVLQAELGWGGGNYVGIVEIAGQIEDPIKLLTSEAYTAMGVGLPDRL